MKTLSCNCRNCGSAMRIEVEDSSFFTDQGLCEMACCDRCYEARERIEKANREKYDRQIERELQEPKAKPWRKYKTPYVD